MYFLSLVEHQRCAWCHCSPAASLRPFRHTLHFGLGVWESPPETGAAGKHRKAGLSLLTPTDTPLPSASRGRPRTTPFPRPFPASSRSTSARRHRLPRSHLRAAHAHWRAASGFWRLLRGAGSVLRVALGPRGCGDSGSGSGKARVELVLPAEEYCLDF